MLLNYLKLSLRLLVRNPFFTTINIVGLSIGFGVFFILWPFTQSELKSDRFIKDHERIARPMFDWKWTDNGGESWGQLNFAHMPAHISNEMKDHGQIEDVTRFLPQRFFWDGSTPGLKSQLILAIDHNKELIWQLDPETAICADRNFLQFFNISLMKGDQNTALDLAESVVISESLAKKIFNDNDLLGKQVKFNAKPFMITGVFKDLPAHSHLQFDIIFSNAGNLARWNTTTMDLNALLCYHYFKMKRNVDELSKILNQNKDKLVGSYLEKNQHIKIDFLSQPLTEIVFNQNVEEPFKTKSKFTLVILAVVSLVVLIMAWINYINLTISRTKTRFKEIATRKVSGALLPDLCLQFICQSAVTNVLAVLVGITLVQVVRQPFTYYFNIHVADFSEWNENIILFFAAIFVLGIVVTASYPAWITLHHSTRQLLTKNVPSEKRITTTIFTTIQYVAALTLITWIFVMHSQLNFILNKGLGLDKDNVVVMDAPVLGLEENGKDKMVSFANHVRNVGTFDLTLSYRVCGDGPYNMELRRTGKETFYGIDSYGGVDENFIPLYKIKMIAGRNFIKDEKGENAVLSRFTTERLGFKSPEEAVGSIIEFNRMGTWRHLEIIGVVEDFRVTPFYDSQNSTEAATGRGQCLTYLNNAYPPAVPERISIKLKAAEAKTIMQKIETLYQQQFPGNIFKWYFLDENVNRQYGDQDIIRNQIFFFTALAVAVACLGLLGMISNTVVQKTKEISIRKILGAGNYNITRLLLGSTVMQVIIATVIGLPIARWFSDRYLKKFTDQIEIQWWHFTVPVGLLFLIMLFTIAVVLWKAAKSNPVEALKYE